MQNLMLKLTPTPSVKPTQEANAANLNLAGLGAENTGVDQQKLFAEMFTKQLIQQRKMLKANEDAVQSVGVPLAGVETIPTQVTQLNGVLTEPSLVEVAQNHALPEEASLVQTSTPDMMLMQIQTPMAVNVPMTKPNADLTLLKTQPAPDTAMTAANMGMMAPTLNDLTTSKNSGMEATDLEKTPMDASKALVDSDLVKPRPEQMTVDKKAASGTALAEHAFKDVMNQVSALGASSGGVTKSEASIQAPSIASNVITTAFGRADWNQAVNQKVVWMVGATEQSATLTLNPPDLGPLQVVIQVDNQHVDTTFISDNPEVRQALEDGMQMLREKMSESGIQLGNAQVNSGDQSKRDAQQMAHELQRQRLANAEKSSPEPMDEKAQVITRHVSNGLVDTFA